MTKPVTPQDMFDMWQKMVNPGAYPLQSLMFPVLDPKELEKKIGELEVVEHWLKANMNMLQLTIKSLQYQRAMLKGGEKFREKMEQGGGATAAPEPPQMPDPTAWMWNMMAPKVPPVPARKKKENPDMSTRMLMSSSAAVLAALGVAITFLPQELLAHVGVQPRGSPVLLIQMLGALFMGMAALNWMNRGNRIGGIFGRPVSMANFVNFAVGAVALAKGAISQQFDPEVVAVAAIYAFFAAWFGWVLFTHPQGGTT